MTGSGKFCLNAQKNSLFLPRLSLFTASVMLIKLVVSFLEKTKEKRQ
ncbi:hypothetical protein PUATCC27989T_01668 [Phytobacter ursingii]|nr:hypothetical protein PUATCC27989T_01668 [Phytobacter ursingii]